MLARRAVEAPSWETDVTAEQGRTPAGGVNRRFLAGQ
jgi:hypothetical protein